MNTETHRASFSSFGYESEKVIMQRLSIAREFMTVFSMHVRVTTSTPDKINRIFVCYGSVDKIEPHETSSEFHSSPESVLYDTADSPHLHQFVRRGTVHVATFSTTGMHVKCTSTAPNATLFIVVVKEPSTMVCIDFAMKYTPAVIPRKGELEITSGNVFGSTTSTPPNAKPRVERAQPRAARPKAKKVRRPARGGKGRRTARRYVQQSGGPPMSYVIQKALS